MVLSLSLGSRVCWICERLGGKYCAASLGHGYLLLFYYYHDIICPTCSADHLSRYTDSPDGDWVIGRYPGDSGLVLATSGSGHAFKVYSTLIFSRFLYHAVNTGCVSTFRFVEQPLTKSKNEN